jgi:hypothetical protein
VMIGEPRFGRPAAIGGLVGSTSSVVPSGTLHRIDPFARSTPTSAPHGGALQGSPARRTQHLAAHAVRRSVLGRDLGAKLALPGGVALRRLIAVARDRQQLGGTLAFADQLVRLGAFLRANRTTYFLTEIPFPITNHLHRCLAATQIQKLEYARAMAPQPARIVGKMIDWVGR